MGDIAKLEARLEELLRIGPECTDDEHPSECLACETEAHFAYEGHAYAAVALRLARALRSQGLCECWGGPKNFHDCGRCKALADWDQVLKELGDA